MGLGGSHIVKLGVGTKFYEWNLHDLFLIMKRGNSKPVLHFPGFLLGLVGMTSCWCWITLWWDHGARTPVLITIGKKGRTSVDFIGDWGRLWLLLHTLGLFTSGVFYRLEWGFIFSWVSCWHLENESKIMYKYVKLSLEIICELNTIFTEDIL